MASETAQKEQSCQYCGVLARACKMKDRQIQRLRNKNKRLMKSKFLLAQKLHARKAGVPYVPPIKKAWSATCQMMETRRETKWAYA